VSSHSRKGASVGPRVRTPANRHSDVTGPSSRRDEPLALAYSRTEHLTRGSAPLFMVKGLGEGTMTSSSCLLRLVPLVLVSSIVVGAIQSAHAVTGECPIKGFNSEIIERARGGADL
jgi:hypothetical protein